MGDMEVQMIQIGLLAARNVKSVHMIGIDGISMSGLAEILASLGYVVTGSDLKQSLHTKKLENMGVKIFREHSAENVQSQDLVVYSAAIKEDNPERVRAKELGILQIDRATLLGEIMKQYPYAVAISGTHGKTTTTSMVSMIMLEAGLDPTIHIGAELKAINGATKLGGEKYFIAEACEYTGSFLKFYPYMAVVLNIEFDHADYFKDLDHVKQTFQDFANLVPSNGYLVGCIDDQNVVELMEKTACQIVSYSVSSQTATWSAKDIEFNEQGCAIYTVCKHGESLGKVCLSAPGMHNVSNSLAAIAACCTLGCSIDVAITALFKFGGADRRFEYKGTYNDIKVVDDYAHHPTEIKVTLKAARNHKGNVWCIFQPHTYTRTKFLLEDFATAFKDADKVVLADIYAAREKDTGEISSSIVAEKININSGNAVYIKGFDAIIEYVKSHALPGDMVITMGAGDIYKVGELLLA